AEVVAEAQALHQLLVEPQRPRHRAPDLRRLEAVREPRAVVVALVVDEDLRLVLEAPERRAVDHAVAVALVARAQGMLGLGMEAPPAVGALHAVGRQVALLPLLLRPAIHERHSRSSVRDSDTTANRVIGIADPGGWD